MLQCTNKTHQGIKMKRNELYFFVSNYITKNAASLKVIVKQNVKSERFALIELEVQDKNIFKKNAHEWQLKAHHLSFYECIAPFNGSISTYHYTAYLLSQNQEYQLHVYFDQNDQQLGPAVLTALNDEHSINLLLKNEEEQQCFSIFASQQSMPVIKQLRRLYYEQLKKDIQQYDTAIREAENHSETSNEQVDLYHQHLDLAAHHLQKILSYHYNRQYCAELKLIQKMREKQAETSPLPDLQTEYQLEIKRNESASSSSSSSNNRDEPIASATDLKPNNKTLDEVIKQAKTELDKYHQISSEHEEKMNEAIHLLNKAHEILNEGMVIDLYDPSELKAFNQLLRQLLNIKNKCFDSLILKYNRPQSLSLLVAHTPELFSTNKIIAYCQLAIRKADAKLLKTLLTLFSIPINTLCINDDSLVLYCYKQGMSNEKYVDVLSVLIEHGANLFEFDPELNLPIPYVLLSKHQHPLKNVLLNTKNKTLLNPQFHKKIIQILEQNVLLMDEEQKKIACAFINRTKKNLELLSKNRSKTDQLFMEKLASQQANIASFYSEELILMMICDEEIQSKVTELQAVTQDYINLLSPKEKRAVLKRCHEEFQNTINQLKTINIDLPAQVIRDQALSRFCLLNEYYQNHIKLKSIQKSLIQFQGQATTRRRVPSQIKKIVLEEKELLTTIKNQEEKLCLSTSCSKKRPETFTQVYTDSSQLHQHLSELNRNLSIFFSCSEIKIDNIDETEILDEESCKIQ